MYVPSTTLVTFSPTGASRTIGTTLAGELVGSNNYQYIDITTHAEEYHLGSDALAIFVVPVYAGRVAPLARQRLEGIRGTNTPAVIVVVYGNRAFEDALIELRDITIAAGFVPFAAAACIGEHSYSRPDKPIAEGRPDARDLQQVRQFSSEIKEFLGNYDINSQKFLVVPGNKEYRPGVQSVPFTPEVDRELCILCGECVEVCPNGVITIDDSRLIFDGQCTLCCSCIKTCPVQALCLNAPRVKEVANMLFENCQERQELQFFW